MYRVTLAINRIPNRNKYENTRLTVYLFGKPKGVFLSDLKYLLWEFTGDHYGYEKEELWFQTKHISMEESRMMKGEAKGLGYYYAEIVHENDNGVTTERKLFNVHRTRFGEEIF